MKKISRYQWLLFLLLAVFIGVLLIISGVIFYTFAVDSTRKNVEKNQAQATEKMADWLDSTLRQADDMSIYANSSTDFMNQLKEITNGGEDNYFDYHPQLNAKFKNFLYSINSIKSVPGRVKLLTKWYDSTGTIQPFDYTPKKSVLEEYYKNLMAMNEYKRYIPPHKNIWSTSGEMVVSVVRPLRDNYSNVYGLIDIMIPVDQIDEIFKDYNVVLINEGKIVYNNAELTDSQKRMFENQTYNAESNTFDRQSDGVVSFYSHVDNAGWVLVQYEPAEEYSKPIWELGKFIIVMYFVALIIILGFLYLIVRNVTKPIRKLTDIVKSASKLQTNIVIDKDEMQGDIEMLATSFQQMVDGIEQRNKQITEDKLAESKFRIMALEAQLNPHFIYNTLTVIGAYGMNEKDDTVYKMCMDLSNMLRYSTDFTKNDTTLQEEISHTIKYLELMQKRFGNILKYEIYDNTHARKIKLPKMIIQPLAENCFMHGLKALKSDWKIIIEAGTLGNLWWVRVRDNGCGFSQEKINYILDATSAGVLIEKKRGIGLINTLLRIKLYYGDKGFYSIYNDGGAVVEVGGPIRNE